jgi:hypothetical protein
MATPSISFINFDATANPVVRFIDIKGQIWDNVAGAMADVPTYADTAIALAENAFINGIPVQIPVGLPAGCYYMLFYSAASPANTDAYTRWYQINWNDKTREITYMRDLGPKALA